MPFSAGNHRARRKSAICNAMGACYTVARATSRGAMNVSELEEFRRQKDAWFKASPDSPLPYGERADFTGLSYYPENAELRLALRPEEFAEQQPITMTTSTGGTQDYLRWGQIHFTVDGQPASLTVYYAAWGDYFVPFVDATSATETYGAER